MLTHFAAALGVLGPLTIVPGPDIARPPPSTYPAPDLPGRSQTSEGPYAPRDRLDSSVP